MSKILVTGANGFIGSALIKKMQDMSTFTIIASYRRLPASLPDNISGFETEDISSKTDWSTALAGTDVVIHLAGLAHEFDKTNGSANQHQRINVDATMNLARQAVELGVKRFIFLSSIGVNGTSSQRPFIESDKPNPKTQYAISKYRAEQQLTQLCNSTNMEFVIIRPPLVYGANAPGAFRRLLKISKLPVPLPLGRIDNKRSFISIANLIDFIAHTIEHKNAVNELFLISDGSDISTSHLITIIRKSLNKPIWLYPIPRFLWELLSALPMTASIAQSLHGSLQGVSGSQLEPQAA
jgi:nucleoside-diphosphate-sugar epimerase